jgi:predicted RNase H-like HicB family nuclease
MSKNRQNCTDLAKTAKSSALWPSAIRQSESIGELFLHSRTRFSRFQGFRSGTKYVIYKEGKYYVSQCINVDVSSFGESIEDAVVNLKEALELYFEEPSEKEHYRVIGDTLLGEAVVNA